ncbi:MAG: hypothetical protein MUP45_03365 [Candidatus Marinimicrobia bacterium]|nr:hypothetical protein [Candidatus Neomarinimicrobiota bacterium]
MEKLALTIPGGYNIEPPSGFVFTGEKANIGAVVSALIPLIFSLAGLLLFGFLIMGGFELLTSAGDPKKVESAKSRLTGALAGFLIIFVAYWLIQILEVIFGIKVF